MERETSNGPTQPKEKLSLSSCMSGSYRYGSIASEPEDNILSSAENNAISPKRAYIAVAVLCYVNLLNYMDRYTIAGE